MATTAPRLVAAPAEGADVERALRTCDLLVGNVSTVVRGKEQEIALVVAALAGRAHVLIEDVPGTAKTVLARALARSIRGVEAKRIQCTPDLHPTDVTGLAVFDQKTREFEFRPGPIFANVVLVDEINRAMPKTQSALLEAMAEGQVTVDGETLPLPRPFFLLATHNPVEHEGTFPLPEAQLDRFLLRISLGYPDTEKELEILASQSSEHPLERLRPVVSAADVEALQRAVDDVYVDDLIRRWIVELVQATRSLEIVDLASSVRGSLALDRAARAWALIQGRDHVVPDDVELLFEPVICHRLLFTPSFVASTAALGREEAFRRFWQCCLEQAPAPR